jgi:hypothetical protein
MQGYCSFLITEILCVPEKLVGIFFFYISGQMIVRYDLCQVFLFDLFLQLQHLVQLKSVESNCGAIVNHCMN